MQVNIEECFNVAITDLKSRLEKELKGKTLECEFNWELSDKTISEIGGRLIEDYILNILPKSVRKLPDEVAGQFTKCEPATSQRAMEDIFFEWTCNIQTDKVCKLLVDIKGHNETKNGSRPNLASIRKCKELYSDDTRVNEELIIFFCRYTPEIIRDSDTNKTIVKYKINEESFGDKGTFLLRNLSDSNLDPANIGSGGQILLARENNIQLIDRSREDFLLYLNELEERLQQVKQKKKKSSQ